MQTRICPECGDDIYANAKSHKCGWRLVPERTIGRPVQHRMEPNAKMLYEAGGKTSIGLTEQQWFNVCRFWPTVARRCSRPFADVSPANPLYATSHQGPLMKHMQSRAPAVEREPGEEG